MILMGDEHTVIELSGLISYLTIYKMSQQVESDIHDVGYWMQTISRNHSAGIGCGFISLYF